MRPKLRVVRPRYGGGEDQMELYIEFVPDELWEYEDSRGVPRSTPARLRINVMRGEWNSPTVFVQHETPKGFEFSIDVDEYPLVQYEAEFDKAK